MPKHAYPEFHKTLLEQSSYPSAPRRIKFEETRRSYLYRTGEQIYKIRKTSTVYSSTAVKERFAQFAFTLGRRWAGEVVQAVVPIVKTAEGYALGGAGDPVDYALCMQQLPESQWMYRLLASEKFTPTLAGRLARFLADQHAAAALEEKAADAGRPDRLHELMDELIYQSRKHIGVTVSEPVLDMIKRPLGHYLEESRRLLARRPKRGRIVDGHGSLVPEHIHLHGNEVHALAPLEAQAKFRVLDAANDVAVLVNSLELRGQAEVCDAFLKRYATASKDRDLPRVLPVYRVLQGLRDGLRRSEWCMEWPAETKERQELAQEAGTYYNLALQVARELPKLI